MVDNTSQVEIKANKIESFLLKDYELKLQYLNNHFTRMWSRFQYYLVFETALVAAFLGLFRDVKGLSIFGIPITVIGLLSSILWYIAGAEDRYLVVLYRQQHVKHAKERYVKQIGVETELADYPYVGEIKKTEEIEPIEQKVYQWRLEEISTTKLAAVVPFLFILWWVTLIALMGSMILLGILAVTTGATYGYLKPGKEYRKMLFKKGILIGTILALIFAGLMVVGSEFLLLGKGAGVSASVEIIILPVLFIIGTFIGDRLEEKSKTKAEMHEAG
ncbi:MAG: hypothetical protein OIN66_12300 [Candidatus Methanoperedens sp.]|nr:hypothetical protein [Candidatus Methanoperedens sp.]